MQARLASNLQGKRSGAATRSPSLLAGKVVDEAGEPLIAAHTSKPAAGGGEGKVRYRYYVSQVAVQGDGKGLRIPARELEALVIARLGEELADPFALADQASIPMQPHDVLRLYGDAVTQDKHAIVRLVEKVQIAAGSVDIVCSGGEIARLLGLPAPDTSSALTLHCEARLARSGRVRLINGQGTSAVTVPDTALLRLIAKGHRWWGELRKGEVDTKTLAQREGVHAAYLTRVLRLAFLSPAVLEVILAGRQSVGATIGELTLGSGVEPHWSRQRRALANR